MIFEGQKRDASSVFVSSEAQGETGVSHLEPARSKRPEDWSYWIILPKGEALKLGFPSDFTRRRWSQFSIESVISLSFATWADQFIGSPLDDHERDESQLRSWLKALTQPLKTGDQDIYQPSHYSAVIGAAAVRVRDLQQPTSVTELANKIGVSTRTLQRAFRSELGVSTKRYLRSQQLRLAHEMLKTGRYSVGFVAQAVGFNHQSRFAKEYSDFFGQYPSSATTARFQAELERDLELLGGTEAISKVVRVGSRLGRVEAAEEHRASGHFPSHTRY